MQEETLRPSRAPKPPTTPGKPVVPSHALACDTAPAPKSTEARVQEGHPRMPQDHLSFTSPEVLGLPPCSAR